MVSSVYRWVGRPYVIEPIGLVAARASIRHLTSKPELVKTVEAAKSFNGGIVVSIRHSRKHKAIK